MWQLRARLLDVMQSIAQKKSDSFSTFFIDSVIFLIFFHAILRILYFCIASPRQGWEKSIEIDILYFLFIECIGAFIFLNEYRIQPCLYFFSA